MKRFWLRTWNPDTLEHGVVEISRWTETWLLASGRSHFTLPVLRMRVSSRPSLCAYMMGAGINSSVSFVA